MSDTTNHLGLPYLQAHQAQKHVTLNESLGRLDALVHLVVKSKDRATPPPAPQAGNCYIIAEGATDEFTGQDGRIAAFIDGEWIYFTPRTGWTAFVEDEGMLNVLMDAGWTTVGQPETLPLLGLNATADPANRLAVASAGALFNHDGNSHRLMVNKATIGDTASLVFQTGFSGRAEIGLTGDDGLSIKTSADGTDWTERLGIPDNDVALFAKSVRTGEVSVAFDTVVEIPTPAAGGFFLFFLGNSAAFPQIADSGILLFDSGNSRAIAEIYLGPNVSNEGTTILTGPDGMADRTCVAVGDGKIYLENRRYPSAVSYRYLFLC